MKNNLKISLATLAAAVLATGCIKEATPTDIAIERQVTLETTIRGIPAALVKAGSTGYAQQGAGWDFSLPAIHLAMESMTGDLVVTGNIGYDWFGQWGTNDALGADYAVGALTWDNYYTWIMMANSVISLIDTDDYMSLDATQRSYLGFAYAYRAMFYFDLVRLYEAAAEGNDVVVGSRYVQGVNVVNWPMSRLLMSYFASMYVRIVTRLPLRDATAGFVCYSRRALETIDLDAIRMKGYGFQIEMKYTAWRLGMKLKEVSIIFVERREGVSKMSGGIFREAFFGVLGLPFRKIRKRR